MPQLFRRRVLEIFFSALRTPASERASLVTALANGDAEVAQAALTLLRLDADEPAFRGGTAVAPAASEAAPSPFAPAEALGPYQLECELGRGAMGVVYRAWDTALRRPVAIKSLLPSQQIDPMVAARFAQESQALARLAHPNIVRAYHLLPAREMQHLVMEYVEGLDLEKLVKAWGALPIAEACDIILQAALGLQHAYEKGIVHRDIKPSNLLLSFQGEVKLTDLGLALLRDRPDGSLRLTASGMFMGTVDYMAPEQGRDIREAGIQADLYSLGCTLYQALTGAPPFARYATLADKLRAHQIEEPPPAVSPYGPLPPQLTAVLARLLAKKPSGRFQTPADLTAALAPLTPSRLTPLGARGALNRGREIAPPGKTEARPRFGRKKALVWGSLVALTLAATLVVWQVHRERPMDSSAEPSVSVLPVPVAPPARPLLGPQAVLDATRTFLASLDAADRDCQRFFTLTNLHNDIRLASQDVEDCRIALAEALRSGGAGAALEAQPIDAHQTIFAVDGRRLGADWRQRWKALLTEYPYGLDQESGARPAAETDAAQRDWLEEPLLRIRADWFVAQFVARRRGAMAGLSEPALRTVRRYEQDLDLTQAACELGMLETTKMRGHIVRSPFLHDRLQLAPLAVGGKISRSHWISKIGPISVFQTMAESLDLGIPIVPEVRGSPGGTRAVPNSDRAGRRLLQNTMPEIWSVLSTL